MVNLEIDKLYFQLLRNLFLLSYCEYKHPKGEIWLENLESFIDWYSNNKYEFVGEDGMIEVDSFFQECKIIPIKESENQKEVDEDFYVLDCNKIEYTIRQLAKEGMVILEEGELPVWTRIQLTQKGQDIAELCSLERGIEDRIAREYESVTGETFPFLKEKEEDILGIKYI